MRFPATAWLARFDSVVGAGRHALAGDRAELPRLDDGAGAEHRRVVRAPGHEHVGRDDAGCGARVDDAGLGELHRRGAPLVVDDLVAALVLVLLGGRRRCQADGDCSTSHGSRCDSCVHLLPHGFLLFVGGSGSCSACYSHLCK